MSASIPTPENFKEKAQIIRKFMKEKYNADVSQGHGLELISQLLGFKDWNTASAASKTSGSGKVLPLRIETIGELKKALEGFRDTDSVDAEFEFRIDEFISKLNEEMIGAGDRILQQFSVVIEKTTDVGKDHDIVTFKLNLDYEDVVSADGTTGYSLGLL